MGVMDPKAKLRWAPALLFLALVAVGAWALLHRGDAPSIRAGQVADGTGEVQGVPALLEDGPRAPPASTLVGNGRARAAPVTEGAATSAGGAPAPQSPAAGPLLPVRVDFFDALTGREVRGVRWRESAPMKVSTAYAGARNSDGGPALPDPDASPSDPATSSPPERPWRTGGESAPMECPPRGLDIVPPEGWLYLDVFGSNSPRSPRARVGRLRVALRAELDVRVEILGPDGRPAEGATVHRAELPMLGYIAPREERMPDGSRRLRGIPFLPGETLSLLPSWTGPPAAGDEIVERSRVPPLPIETEEVDLAAFTSAYGWRGPMPPRLEEGIRAVIRLPGPTGPMGGNETDNDLPTEESFGEDPPADPALLGSVRLRLVDRSGRAVPHARVAVGNHAGVTDGEGRVLLKGVPQGEAHVRILDPGWTFPASSVVVRPRTVTDTEIRELVGGDVEIVVSDEDGHPAPFAFLLVTPPGGGYLFDVDDDGVQRLDRLVGGDGRRLLEHLPPGVLHVTAQLGSRTGDAETVVVDRARRVLPIRIHR